MLCNEIGPLESSYPITFTVEAKSHELFVAHRGIYSVNVYASVYAHVFLSDKNVYTSIEPERILVFLSSVSYAISQNEH